MYLSHPSQHLDFRDAPRLYVDVLKLNQSCKAIIPGPYYVSGVYFENTYVSGVPDNSEPNVCSRSIFIYLLGHSTGGTVPFFFLC